MEKLNYTKIGDYNVPNLVVAPEKTNYKIGKYGKIRLHYLKTNNKAEYTILFMNGTLNEHLHQIYIDCNEQIKLIISQLVKQENITEELKEKDQMEWVKQMNNIKSRAEECVLKELIYN